MSEEKRNDALKAIMMAAMKKEKPAVTDGKIALGNFRYLLSDNGSSAILLEYLADEEEVSVPGYIRVPGESADRQVSLISMAAFLGRENVREVRLEEGIMAASGSFIGCSALETIHLPDSIDADLIGGAVRGCPGFGGFAVKDSNPLYRVQDGFLIRKDSGLLVSGPRDRTECVIPEGVTAIADSAFMYSSRLERVAIPEGVKTIGEQVFAFCPVLQEVQLPMSLEDIGCGAFTDCEKLESLCIPDHTTFAGKVTRDIGWIVSDGPVDAGV